MEYLTKKRCTTRRILHSLPQAQPRLRSIRPSVVPHWEIKRRQKRSKLS